MCFDVVLAAQSLLRRFLDPWGCMCHGRHKPQPRLVQFVLSSALSGNAAGKRPATTPSWHAGLIDKPIHDRFFCCNKRFETIHLYFYLETHLALISANFIFQEKDAHFKKTCPFPGMGREKTPIGREKTPTFLKMNNKKQRRPLLEDAHKAVFLHMSTY